MLTVVENPPKEAEPATDAARGWIFERDGCLWMRSPKPQVEGEEQIPPTRVTDCGVKVISAERVSEEFTFKVELTRLGAAHEGFLPSKVLEAADSLNAWAMARGLSNWNLTHPQRLALKKFLFSQPGARRVIDTPKFSGYLPEYGVTLAVGHSFDAEGHAVLANDRGSYELVCSDGEKREFRIGNPVLAPGMQSVDKRMLGDPDKIMDTTMREDALADAYDNLREFSNRLLDNMTLHHGTVAMGWAVANLFYEETFRAETMFPILYVYGETQSGKDTFAQKVMNLTGMGHIRALPANKQQTTKGLRNTLDVTSGFPAWVNELRADDKECDWILPSIRTIFDGQAGNVGTKDHNLRTFAVRRGMMLSGQSLVGSDAEFSRYVVIRLRKKDLRKHAHNSVREMEHRAARAFSTLIGHRGVIAKTFAARIQAAREWLHSASYDDDTGQHPLMAESRQTGCWAVVLAGISVFLGMPAFDPLGVPQEILAHVTAAMRDAQVQAEEDGTMGSFWDELEAQSACGELTNSGGTRWCRMIDNEKTREKEVVMWTAYIRRAYQASRSRPNKLAASFIRAEIDSIRGHAGERAVKMGDGMVRRCDIFKASNGLPDWVKDLASKYDPTT